MHLQQTHLNHENEGSMFFQSTGVHVQDAMMAETRKSHCTINMWKHITA